MAVFINQRVHDWVSALVNLGPPLGNIPATISAITYPEHGQEKTLQYGIGPRPVGFSRDHYTVGVLEMDFLVAEWDELRSRLGSGYGSVEVSAITITYADAAAGLSSRTDQFLSCHVTKEKPVVTQGTDPAKITVTFQPTEMILNGIPYTVQQAR